MSAARARGAWIVWRRCYASTVCYSYQDARGRADRRLFVRLWRAFGAWRRLDYGKHFVS